MPILGSKVSAPGPTVTSPLGTWSTTVVTAFIQGRLMILVDTNIPLRIAQIGHPHRQPALDALRLLKLRDEERFTIAPQSLYEM
jgi:hypothetical protein